MESVSLSEQKVSIGNLFKNPLFFKKMYSQSVSNILFDLNKNQYDQVVDSMLVASGRSLQIDTIYFNLLDKIVASSR